MPKWKKETSKENGKKWTDWVHGRYRLEQGRDAYESRHGRPWLLTKSNKQGVHHRIGAFESLAAADAVVQEREAKRLTREVVEAAKSAGIGA
jgi:hypothetical protein